MNKRINVHYLSQSITVSVKTEALLLHTDEGHFFLEYPTNRVPSVSTFKLDKKVKFCKLTEEEFLSLGAAFITYESLHTTKPFLHAPSFLIGWCQSEGLSCDILN